MFLRATGWYRYPPLLYQGDYVESTGYRTKGALGAKVNDRSRAFLERKVHTAIKGNPVDANHQRLQLY